MTQLKGKVALVTGGATGIGLAAAKLFLQRGAKVVIAGRRESEGQKALQQLKEVSTDVAFVATDVADNAAVATLIAETVKRFGQLDIAFNNAGIEGKFGPITDAAEEDFDSVIDINLKGVWLCCKHEIAQFRKQGTGGAIVNTSSWLARGAAAGSAIYSASKAGVDGMVRALALEIAADGIRINNVQPGYIYTPMFERFFPKEGLEQALEIYRKHAPVGRFAKPEEVAELAVWLGSPEASFVTGESILVDGGMAIGGQRM